MVGKTIAHFKILAKIAEGGMGVVYRAEDQRLGREVAIKVLPPELVADEERRAHLIQEARTAAAISHPNIATIHEIGEVDGVIFIAMELVAGQSLADRIGGKPLPLEEALRIAMEMAEGLAAAHKVNIAHRDLKPDNAIIGPDGHVKLLDFGLARLMDEPGPEVIDGVSPTGPIPGSGADGRILGTPAYMSPEQARGRDWDTRTDIFSFGSTFYEMLTGRAAFRGDSSSDTISNILSREPTPALHLNPDAPEAVQWILDKCLAKDAAQRYQDTRDLVVDLRRLLHGSGPQHAASGPMRTGTRSGPVDQLERGRGLSLRRVATGAAVVGILALAAFAIDRKFGGSDFVAPTIVPNSLAVFAFENKKEGDDPQRFGEILQELLITDLSGLPGVKVFSSQRLGDVRKQLDPDSDRALDAALAEQVAERTGAESMLTGSISQLGDKWILTSQLVDVASHTVIRSKRIDGDDLYAMVDLMSEEITGDLSVDVAIEMADTRPIKEKTSGSIEAYRFYLDGSDQLDKGRFPEAVAAFNKAIAIDPNFGQAYYKLAIARWWPGDNITGAREPLNHLLDNKLYGSQREKLMAEAALALIAYRYVEGQEIYRELVEAYPEEKEVWYGYGEALFHRPGGGMEEEAKEAFERAVALDPDFKLPYRHIFDVYNAEFRYDEAIARAEALIERDPTEPQWYRYYSFSVALVKEEPAVREAVERALAVNVSDEDKRDLYKGLAHSAAMRSDIAKREEYLRKALAVDPDHDDMTVAGGLLGVLYKQRRYAEVEALVGEGVLKHPESQFYIGQQFNLYSIKREFKEALRYAEQLVSRTPENSVWHNYRVAYAVCSGDELGIQRAVSEALTNMNNDDDLRNLYSTIGDVSADCGNYTQAQTYLQMGIDIDPEQDYPNLLRLMGRSAQGLGHYEEAERWYRKGLDRNPTFLDLQFDLVQLQFERGEFEEARARIEELLAQLPPSEMNRFRRVGPLLIMGKRDEAEKLLAEGLVSLPEELAWELLVDFPFGAAWMYMSQGEFAAAQEKFRRALALDLATRDPLASDGMGLSLLFMGKLGEAETAFQMSSRTGYGSSMSTVGLALVALARKNYPLVEHYLREIDDEGIVHVNHLKLKCYLYANQGLFRRALPFAEAAQAMDQGRESCELLAWILVKGELDVERGIALANLALDTRESRFDPSRLNPFRMPPEYSLGIGSLKSGHFQEALTYLELASAARPENETIQADLERARIIAGGKGIRGGESSTTGD